MDNTESRTIYIVGEINPEMARQTMIALEKIDVVDGPIRIVLNSEGGDEQDGYAIYDAIMQCRNLVMIEGFGSVMSIAAAIFQAGDVRQLAPNAMFMIHHGSVSPVTEQDTVLEMAEQIKKDNERYYNILSSNSGQPHQELEEWCRAETYFTAEEAVAVGFADSVMEHLKKKPVHRKKRKSK